MFEMLTDRISTIVCGNLFDVDLHFYLAVLHQLSERTLDYVKLLCFEGDGVLNTVVKNKDSYNQQTIVELAYVLKHAVKVLLEIEPLHDQIISSLIQEIRNSLIEWLCSSTSSEFQVASLDLLSECVKSPTFISTLLLSEEREGSLLIMGLKRILALKQDKLILMGTMCLTKLVESISEPFQIKMILDSDLAELIFEFLHTSNVHQLCCVFQCLKAMAAHQLFFEKCHAVYGLESTLSAIRVAMDTNRTTVLEQGLSFLTCLLSRQPENMPLFLNQSWLTCANLLQASLKKEYQWMIHTALCAVEAFLRDVHQQNLVDLKAILLLVKTVISASQDHFQMLYQEREDDMSFEGLNCLIAIVHSINKTLLSSDVLCGNESSSLTALQQTLKSFCIGFLLPWTKTNIMESADKIVFEGNGTEIISELEKSSVETWFTAGPAVFSWAFLTPEKGLALGKPMVCIIISL
ncbi:meiosis inhibitor protein 1 [Elysia marginata]|uniref:Meiosis inhibitor protein 1 n=1 Tax=Elysia marginata TaxID=1093978 RepID=A0AAV4IF27_9GAST|nr:meiosis inhibitor protein 1 [Elysia marginata]